MQATPDDHQSRSLLARIKRIQEQMHREAHMRPKIVASSGDTPQGERRSQVLWRRWR